MRFILAREREEAQVPVTLELVNDGEAVTLKAYRGKNDDSTRVLTINTNGTIWRWVNVNKGLGFKLDAKGRVRIV